MGVRVLVVDDAPDLRRLIETIVTLHDKGWEVAGHAGDGRSGVEAARETQPDLVLLDVAMPVLDGIEALPLVREAAPDACVVVLTGFSSDRLRQAAMQAGAHGCLEKDDLVAMLIPRLEQILAARGDRPATPG